LLENVTSSHYNDVGMINLFSKLWVPLSNFLGLEIGNNVAVWEGGVCDILMYVVN